MDRDSFIADMTIAFAPKKNLDKKSDYVNQITVFADKCPENSLHSVYSYAVSYEKYPDIKKVLFPFAREQGFIIDNKTSSPEKKWYYKCNGFYKNVQTGEDSKTKKPIMEKKKFECDTLYSSNSGGCPNCGSTSASVVMSGKFENGNWRDLPFPDEVKLLREQCFLCGKYNPDGKGDGFRVYGPSCHVHGGYNSPENDEQCKSCACRSCCIDSRDYKYNTQNYFYGKDGEKKDISQDWLKASRNPGSEILDVKKLSLSKKTTNINF